MEAFYCRICNVRRVGREGDVCARCQAAGGQADEPEQGANAAILSPRRGRQLLHTASEEAANVPEPSRERQVPADAGLPAPQKGEPVSGRKTMPQAEGIVRNVAGSKDETSGFGRWMRSFTYGVPFPRTDDMTEFQVFSGRSTGTAADKVVAYGRIVSGRPAEGSSARVYGRRTKQNVLIASDVENTTDGSRAEFRPAPLPAMAVRVITILALCVIFGLIAALVIVLAKAGGAPRDMGAALDGLPRIRIRGLF